MAGLVLTGPPLASLTRVGLVVFFVATMFETYLSEGSAMEIATFTCPTALKWRQISSAMGQFFFVATRLLHLLFLPTRRGPLLAKSTMVGRWRTYQLVLDHLGFIVVNARATTRAVQIVWLGTLHL